MINGFNDEGFFEIILTRVDITGFNLTDAKHMAFPRCTKKECCSMVLGTLGANSISHAIGFLSFYCQKDSQRKEK